MTKWRLIHIKSKQRDVDGVSPKLPSSGQLQYGEIAINFGRGIESIAIRNEDDEIVRFIPEREVKKYVDDALKKTMSEIKKAAPPEDGEISIDSGEY